MLVEKFAGSLRGGNLVSDAIEAKRRWNCGGDLTRGACPQSLCARGLKFASILANNGIDDSKDCGFEMRSSCRCKSCRFGSSGDCSGEM